MLYSGFQPLQVSALTMTNLSMSKTLEETRLESEKAKTELILRGEGYKSSLKVNWLAKFSNKIHFAPNIYLVPAKRETRASGNRPWTTKKYIQVEKRGCSIREENWCRMEEIGSWSKGVYAHETLLTIYIMSQEGHERCLRLKANIKSLEESLQQKTMEVACMQERWHYDYCIHAEDRSPYILQEREGWLTFILQHAIFWVNQQ